MTRVRKANVINGFFQKMPNKVVPTSPIKLSRLIPHCSNSIEKADNLASDARASPRKCKKRELDSSAWQREFCGSRVFPRVFLCGENGEQMCPQLVNLTS